MEYPMNAIRIVCFTVIAGIAASSAAAKPATGIARQRTQDTAPGQEYEPLPLGVGLRVFIDPATGETRAPTKEELAAISSAARESRNKSSEGLIIEYRPDGSKHVNLRGRFMHSMRVTLDADGSTSYRCTDHGDDAHASTPASAAAPADR